MQGTHKAHNKHIACAEGTLRSTYKEVMAARYQEITVIYANDLADLSTLWGFPEEFPPKMMSFQPCGFVYIASFRSANEHPFNTSWLCFSHLIWISQ